MKTKEISVAVSKSKNYQSYKCEMTFTLEEGDDQTHETQVAQAICRKRVMEQIALDTPK